MLAVVSEKAANEILDGKTELGANTAAAAGPTGAQANGYTTQAEVLRYSRSKEYLFRTPPDDQHDTGPTHLHLNLSNAQAESVTVFALRQIRTKVDVIHLAQFEPQPRTSGGQKLLGSEYLIPARNYFTDTW